MLDSGNNTTNDNNTTTQQQMQMNTTLGLGNNSTDNEISCGDDVK